MRTVLLSVFLFIAVNMYSQNNAPYSNNFDAYATESAFLNEWTTLNPNNDGGKWIFDYSSYFGYNSSNAPIYMTGSTNAGDDWAISPALNLETGKTYQLSFKYAALGNGSYEKLKVSLGTSAQTSSFTNVIVDLGSFTTTDYGTTFNTSTSEFTVTQSGTYYIGFLAYSSAGNMGIAIDNFDLSIQTVIENVNFAKQDIRYFVSEKTLNLQNVNEAQIGIYSSEGKLLKLVTSSKTNNICIDLKQFENGVYFMKLIKDNEAISKRFFLQ